MKYQVISKVHLRFSPVLLLVSATLLLAGVSSCSNDLTSPDTGEIPVNEFVPIQVSAGMSAKVNAPGTRTASTIDTDGARMGVFRVTEASKGYDAVDNQEYTYSQSIWTTASNPILVGGHPTTLCAYYPYGTAAFSGTSTTLSAQKYENTKVFWFAASGGNSITNKAPSATFAMQHSYSRLTVSIKRHATNYVAGNCNITDVNLQNSSGNNFFASRTLDISDGSNGGSATANGWTYALNTGDIAAGATNSSYDVLVPPQSISSGLTITLTIDGVNRAVTIPATEFSNSALEAGRQYSIGLSITDTAVTPDGNVAITDMTTDGTDIKNDTPVEL